MKTETFAYLRRVFDQQSPFHIFQDSDGHVVGNALCGQERDFVAWTIWTAKQRAPEPRLVCKECLSIFRERRNARKRVFPISKDSKRQRTTNNVE